MDYIPYGAHWITKEDVDEVVNVLNSNWITTGPKIKEFEDALSSYVGCNHSVVVNSGTSALDIAVQSLDLEVGSEIITTPFTFAATSNSIVYNRMKPVFADINTETFNIDPESIRDRITDKTKAIIYVDYAGQPCDIKSIKEIADEYDLSLIEDACHAIGAEYKGKKVGHFADMTVFSFHPVKHITTGEGGAVITNRNELYEKLSILRNHGIDKSAEQRYGPNASWAYDMKCLGRNYRITDFQCALGISQLNKLDMFIDRRIELVQIYEELLKDMEFITLPKGRENIKHVWHLYTILLDRSIDRDKFFNSMRKDSIGVNVHYIPIYRHSYYQNNYPVNINDFPITEDVFSRIITLPLHPQMSVEDVKRVLNAIIKAHDISI